MYEWTTEMGKHDTTYTTYVIVRGGSFYSQSHDPASYRRGNIESETTKRTPLNL